VTSFKNTAVQKPQSELGSYHIVEDRETGVKDGDVENNEMRTLPELDEI
jgi:hypothetical protein